MNVYVSNLSFNVNDNDLFGFFASYGEVTSAKVINANSPVKAVVLNLLK